MKQHTIDLTQLTAKGQATCEYKDNILLMTTSRDLPSQRFDVEYLSINSYIALPDRYRLPLRIDMTVKIDAPALYLLIGKGRINLGTLWSSNRRIDDIVEPTRKIMNYHNHINMNEFTNISVLYDLKEMQILINGEERYYSKKERYMKSPAFREMNEEGFEIKLTCDKLVEACIKSIAITEYEDTCCIVRSGTEMPTASTRNEAIAIGEKPTFEKCISLLPEFIQNEIIKNDEYIRSLKPLKFKRQIEKNGNKITYVASKYGLSYAIYLSNDVFDHSLQWYLITNGKPETWHRKADRMEEVLITLNEKSTDFAERIFNQLEDCVGCYTHCLAKTRYQFQERHKIACHGKLKFKMSVSGFEDMLAFVDEINQLAQKESI